MDLNKLDPLSKKRISKTADFQKTELQKININLRPFLQKTVNVAANF